MRTEGAAAASDDQGVIVDKRLDIKAVEAKAAGAMLGAAIVGVGDTRSREGKLENPAFQALVISETGDISSAR